MQDEKEGSMGRWVCGRDGGYEPDRAGQPHMMANSTIPPLNTASVMSLQLTNTRRSVFNKLELNGDARQQLEAVQRAIYHVDLSEDLLAAPAKNSQHWKTTDDLLYAQAKASYDGITSSFQRSPRVYKLEAVKDKVWASAHPAAPEPPLSATPSPKRRRKLNEALPPVPQDDVQTFLDPFAEGRFQAVWQEKLQLLEKLTPREDLDGYEYREDYEEQAYRFSLQRDFQERLLAEVHRRVDEPTDIEQVEDVLFDIVEIVCEQNDAIERKRRAEELRKKNLLNPVTQGAKLRPLQRIEGMNDTLHVLTDMEYVDAVVTSSGHVLPKSIPGQVIAQFRQEQRLLRALKEKSIAEQDEERRKPLSTKLRTAVLSAKQDLSGSVRKVLRDVLDKTLVLPSRPLRDKCADLIATGSQGLINLAKDPQNVIDSISEYMLDRYDRLVDRAAASQGDGQDALVAAPSKPVDIKDLNLTALKNEAKRRLQSGVDKLDTQGMEMMEDADLVGDIPLTFPDAVIAKFTLHADPPPAYVFRPKKTMKKELKKFKRKTLVSMAENKARMLKSLEHFMQRTGIKPKPLDDTIKPSAVHAYAGTEAGKRESHEVVYTKKLVGGKDYTGFLLPEHMFVYEEEDEEETDVVFVYDASERKAFEANFLDQLANIACLPSSNFTIEQVAHHLTNTFCDTLLTLLISPGSATGSRLSAIGESQGDQAAVYGRAPHSR